MTGSIHQLDRQSSATVSDPNMEKAQQANFGRSSSIVDHPHPFESIFDINDQKDVFFAKRERTSTGYDSGTEELEILEQLVNQNATAEKDDSLNSTFGATVDEGYSEYENEESSKLFDIENDLDLAKTVRDEEKKDFCRDTSVAFHAEFARLISIPLNIKYGVRYYLFAEGELPEEFYMNIQSQGFLKLDNAKAQFKCPNVHCQHVWTSMRARIVFTVFGPDPGFIKLEIIGQACQHCGTEVDAVWYIDEVCRVMKNLAKSIYEKFFPQMLNQIELENSNSNSNEAYAKEFYRRRHDPNQRKGKMHKPHPTELCLACKRGLCYA